MGSLRRANLVVVTNTALLLIGLGIIVIIFLVMISSTHWYENRLKNLRQQLF